MSVPAELRERLAADYQPVRALPAPLMRALWMLPLAAIALLAAPIVFNVRGDAPRLGWNGVWGLSLMQTVIGAAVLVAALRESVPGRAWSRTAIALWLIVPLIAIVAVTLFSWNVSPVLLRSGWWIVAGVCFAGSAATAMPLVAFAAIMAARAYPLRPAIAGLLLGLGAGLIADAGWRVFCHYSEPAHVLTAHLAAVVIVAVMGALVSMRFGRS